MAYLTKETIKKAQTAETSDKKYTILLVDDEDLNLLSLVELLEEDYQLLTANDGEEALELVKNSSEPIHLIITDQRMPNMTGVEFLKQTLPLIPQTVRIILTAFTDVNVIVDSINEGNVYKFMIKPFEPKDMVVTIKRALEAYQLEVENHKLIEELTKLNTDLEQKVEKRTEAIQDFYHFISHELRTPITVIQQYLRFLQQGMKCESPSDNQTAHLKIVDKNANRMIKLVNQILNLAKIESEKAPPLFQSLHLNPLIQNAVEQLRSLFKPEVTILTDLMIPEQPVRAVGDDLEIVLDNLISNAAKYTEKGAVHIKTEPMDNGIQISIVDTGVGIDESQIDQVFDQFSRVGDLRMAQGVGLGLYITKVLVEHMEGQIGVTSKKDEGSTFWVWLPLA